MELKNILVGQSGGPTAVINSSLYGAAAEARLHPEKIGKCFGMINGIEGFLKGRVLDFHEALPGDELKGLLTTPGAYLGSCRYKLPEDLEDPVYRTLFEKFEEMEIGYFLYIGGNDSMDTVSKLSRYGKKTGSSIVVLGEPKTIDNAVDASVYDSRSVTIVEIMGRHAGWLTAAGVLARKFKGDNPLLVYLPEVPFDQEAFLKKVEECFSVNNAVVVCVSEGIRDKDGVFVCEYDSEAGLDSFGHKMLAGCGKYLERLVRGRMGVKARSVELNVSQRCSASMLSAADQQEAVMAGRYGVQAALDGETGKMISFVRTSDSPYSLSCALEDVDLICNQEKTVPLSWITGDGTDLGEEFLTYAKPLVKGNVQVPADEDGLPLFVYRK